MEGFLRHGRFVTLAFEATALIAYSYTLCVDINLVRRPSEYRHFGGRLRYLTFWTFVIQMIHFFLSICWSLFGWKRPNRYFSLFSAGIVFPACFFVSISFWVLYSIDREIIYPKILDAYIPVWVNHMLHTSIVPLLLIDRYLTKLQYPNPKDGMTVTLIFMITYFVWLMGVSKYNGVWVYPVFEYLSWPGRIVFVLICGLLFLAFYQVGVRINKLFWGENTIGWVTPKSKEKLKKSS